MPWYETVLIYGVIPLVVVLLFALATLIPGRSKDRTRYKPGQPWAHQPVWYEPHPDVPGVPGGHGDDDPADHGSSGDHGRRGLGATAAALAIGQHPHEDATSHRTAAGGARGTW
ncbi:aa3-type cytochrome oxidase subunit CtaJ [Modestobacter sp. SYSU DS0290]